MPPVRPRPRPQSAAELHRAWLELVETDGPFLAVPPLKRVWPQGMPALADDRLDALREAKPAFEHAWEDLDVDPDDPTLRDKYAAARDEWVRVVLRDLAGWGELLDEGPSTLATTSPDRRVRVTPNAVLRDPAGGVGALVTVVDRCESPHQAGVDGWAASPIDRMDALLRGSGVEIGVVTDGRWWALVCARKDAMVASGVVDALSWVEEPLTRNAFLTVIARRYIVGGDPAERLPTLFEASVAAAEEVTEALGAQVRRAVEWLVQAFDETAAESRRRGLVNPLPADPGETYATAVTVLMRVVFLLFAEERALLPQGPLFQQGYGISGELRALERRRLEEGEESLDSTYLTWHRLLATSQALYQGASFEDMRMPAYGGSLFDPGRHAWLTAATDNGTLAVTVSDRVLLHILRSVQVAQLAGGDARQISFRDIDVEQIGYIYEGLLGYTCRRVTEVQVGLLGTRGAEPEVPLAVLESLDGQPPAKLAAAILAWLKKEQPGARPPSATALAATPGEDVDRHLRAVTDDEELRDRLRRWAPVTRRDLRNRPAVVLTGGLLVAETASRRHAGAHYTPRKLAEDVVKHALAPLCYFPGPHQQADGWVPRPSQEILRLKVVDIAAGSGAFLVAAARYLADRLVEAWIAEHPANAARPDLRLHAIREVVAHCLYGADINAMAVEMCKLSLWLVSLDRDLPFSFVDDKILHGNSLLGLTERRQLSHLHIAAPDHHQPQLSTVDIGPIFDEAAKLREELASEVVEFDPQRSAAAKRRLLAELRAVTGELRLVADGIVAAGLRLGGKPGRALDEAYENLAVAVTAALPGAGQPDRGELESIVCKGLEPTVPTDYEHWRPLHWVLEVPDVMINHGGFDAVVGNPPFLTSKKMAPAFGRNYREWLVAQVANDVKGDADFVTYFLLRAFALLRSTGTLGIIATNTLGQGDSRRVGLDQLVDRGFTITRAVQSATWPGTAGVEYAAVWGSRGEIGPESVRHADGIQVRRILTLLEGAGEASNDAVRLLENRNVAFVGCYVNGAGFVIGPQIAEQLIAANPINRSVVRPYLGGHELNHSFHLASPNYVIDFNAMSEEQARAYEAPFKHVVENVLAYRQGLYNKPRLQRLWWRYESTADGLRRATVNMGQVLAMAVVSKTLMPARVDADQVFSHKTCVFALDSYSDQAFLSSSIHWIWAVRNGSTMRIDPNYSVTDIFETLPRPPATRELEEAGRSLEEGRKKIMRRRQIGLTDLYSLVNGADTRDPDVTSIRNWHADIDHAVVAAFGWPSIDIEHGIFEYRRLRRWTVEPASRIEIIDRLLAENLRRAKAESGPVDGTTRRRRRSIAGSGQGTFL
jgi:hypothetical protein